MERLDERIMPGVLTERQLCEKLGLSKDQLDHLRRENAMPYIRLSRAVRLYVESDLLEFFQGHCRVPRLSSVRDEI